MPTDLEVFARHAQPELPGCPVVVIADTLIKVVQRLCEQADLLKEVITFDTVAGTRLYTLTMPTGMVLSRVTHVRTANMPNGLHKTSEAEYANVTDTGMPHAFYVDGLQRLGLVNTPNAIYTVNATVVMIPSDDVESLETALYDHYLSLITTGVKSILMLQPNKEWSNPDLALRYADKFEDGVTKARIANLGGNIGTPMRVKPRRFGS